LLRITGFTVTVQFGVNWELGTDLIVEQTEGGTTTYLVLQLDPRYAIPLVGMKL
jgi:hypothetical protein